MSLAACGGTLLTGLTRLTRFFNILNIPSILSKKWDFLYYELSRAKDIIWEAPDYQNMASFRNMLVHHYEKVEDEVVFGIFKNKLGDFDLFRKYILEYLRKDKNP